MRGPVGRLLTAQIFRGMAREFQPEKAKGLDAVMLWEVGADGERVERWQLTIRDQRCRAGRPTGEDPALTLRLDRATLLELATGLANPPQLFITGRLKISGDLMLAQRLTTLFRIPKARASTGAQSAKSST
jgi:putative sterol carrier protein